MHFNIQEGNTFTLNELSLLLKEKKVEIICLVKHWLKRNQIDLLNNLN